jgi:hypothetical protein
MKRASYCSSVLIAAVAVTFLMTPAMPSHAQTGGDAPPRVVLIRDTAWVVGESEPITGPHLIGTPAFSPDGNALVTVQARRAPGAVLDEGASEKDSDFSLVYWERFTRRASVVWRYRAATPDEKITVADAVSWMRDSAHVAFTLTRSERKAAGGKPAVHASSEVVIVDVRRGGGGSVRTFTLPSNLSLTSVTASPRSDMFAVASHDYISGAAMHFINADGRLVRTVTFPPAQNSMLMGGAWVDGNTLTAIRLEAKEEPGHGLQTVIRPYRVDLRDGTATRLDRSLSPTKGFDVPQPTPGASLPLRLLTEPAPATAGIPPFTNVWLEAADKSRGSTEGRALVAGDARGVQLLGDPAGSAGIVYQARGTLLYAPLVRQRRSALLHKAADIQVVGRTDEPGR